MSSLTGNHAMDLIYLLKENLKSLRFGFLITGRSFKNLSYLSSCSLSQRLRFRRIRSNVLRGIESDLVQTKASAVASQCILRSRSLCHPLSSSMLKNKRIFSLVISKLMPTFYLWLYNVVPPRIISTNTLSNNNSTSIRGVTISSSVLNFGMFAHTTTLITLISRFAHIITKTSGFGYPR